MTGFAVTDGLRRSNDREPGAVPEEETPDTGESNPVMRILDSLLPSPPPQNQKFLDPNHQGPSQMESEAKETLEAPAPERALPTAAEGADRPVGFSPEPAAALEEQVPEEEAPLAPVRQWGWLPWRRRGDDPSPWRGTGGEEESGAVNPSAPPQEAAEGAEGVDAATKETHAHPPIPADPAGEDVPPSPRNSRWQEILTPNYLKMWSGFFFLNLHFTIFNLLPYYLELRGAAPWLYGSISGVFGFSSMAALLILGRYVDRFSRKTTVGVSMIFAALGNLLAIWAMWQPGLYWYFLVRLLQGVFLGVGFPLIYGWLVELSQLRHRHIVVAWFGIGGIVANALGPSLGELTLSLHREPGNPYSYGSVFGLSLIFLGLSLLFFLMAKDRYPTREQQQFRGGVLPLLRSHPVALLATVTLVFGGIYGVL
ncbi:MAG: MFS transporter, partial [Deltaproteobacteria bacterium]|nr:MFS transporter [Deltaproteobacteria bacterium]